MMGIERKQLGRLLAGITISVLALALVARGMRWSSVQQALAAADYRWLAPAALLTLLGLGMRALRWRLLFPPPKPSRLGNLLDSLNIGYLLSNVLPARLGDLARAYLISEWEAVGKASALSTIASERLVDALTVVVFLFLLLPVLRLPDWALRSGVVAGALFLAGILTLVWLAGRRQHVQRRLSAGLARMHFAANDAERWAARLVALLDSFATLRAPSAGLQVALWSVITWGDAAAAFYFVFRAFHLAVPPTAAVFTLAVVALGMVVPAAPGQVGIFEGAGVVALGFFGVQHDRALSAILVLHAMNYALLSGAGLWSLARRGVSYKQILSHVK